jgi:hypothetical protein
MESRLKAIARKQMPGVRCFPGKRYNGGATPERQEITNRAKAKARAEGRVWGRTK